MIYVKRLELIQDVLMARYSKKGTGYNFCDTILWYHNCLWTKILARYLKKVWFGNRSDLNLICKILQFHITQAHPIKKDVLILVQVVIPIKKLS